MAKKKLGRKLGTPLVADANSKSMGIIMIALGIAVGAGVCYWFEWYQLAYWILIYAIVYGILSALRAILKVSNISRGQWRPRKDRP
jgi:4-hydroxybenzoate polyprenyltransferase